MKVWIGSPARTCTCKTQQFPSSWSQTCLYTSSADPRRVEHAQAISMEEDMLFKEWKLQLISPEMRSHVLFLAIYCACR